MDTSRAKRGRSLSSASSSSAQSEASGSVSPPPKYHRSISQSLDLKFICTLPPTCSQPSTSTSYASQDDLDRHQEAFHKWICHVPIRDRDAPLTRSAARESEAGDRLPEGFVGGAGFGKKAWKECGKAFPDERLLDLHHTETHDAISREKQNRGEKICFLPNTECSKVFLTPGARRKHLIAKHKYPQGYFFAITNHGLNQIAQEDGFAASLIRPRKYGPARASTTAVPAIDAEPPDPKAKAGGPSGEAAPEVDMAVEDLTKQLGGMQSSLSFVPRGVRKKKQEEAKDMMVS